MQSFINSVMGCCYSWCQGDKESQNGEASERTGLLDPVSNCTSIQRVQSDDYFTNCSEGVSPLNDEQAAKKKILQDAAADMIDVSGPYQMDPHEYLERSNQYSRRLALHSAKMYTPQPPKFILEDVPDPEVYLSAPPIPDEHYFLITKASKAFQECIKQVKVIHKEDIVVPFEIPN